MSSTKADLSCSLAHSDRFSNTAQSLSTRNRNRAPDGPYLRNHLTARARSDSQSSVPSSPARHEISGH